jgi:hypothetical protein
VDTFAPNKWARRRFTSTRTDQNLEEGILENKSAYTTEPAGVTGDQFYTFKSYRGPNQRSMFQYINDGQSTKGEITASIDYWVQGTDAGEADPAIFFQIIAFDDASTLKVDVTSAKNAGGIKAGTYISAGLGSGDAPVTMVGVDEATGFQTLEYTLDLGTTGYNYIGVIFGYQGTDTETPFEVKAASFDNLQVNNSDFSVTLEAPKQLTWLTEPVVLDADVVPLDPNYVEGALTYSWYAEPNGLDNPDLAVIITPDSGDNSVATLVVTNDAPTGEVLNVAVTVVVTNDGGTGGTGTSNKVVIVVYDTACQLTREALGLTPKTDLVVNCKTDLADLALLAAAWMESYEVDAPQPR